jgi:hypothetical protein
MKEFVGRKRQGGWIGAAAAIVGAVAGVYSAVKSSGGGAGASKSYYDWLATVGKQQWQQYQANVVPQLQALSSQAKLDPELRAGLAAETTKGAYDVGAADLGRSLAQTRSPGDPGYAAAIASYRSSEAPAVSSAITNSRLQTEQANWERALQTIGAWQGLPQGTSNVAAGASGLINAQGAIDARAARSVYGGLTLAANARRFGNIYNRGGQQDPYLGGQNPGGSGSEPISWIEQGGGQNPSSPSGMYQDLEVKGGGIIPYAGGGPIEYAPERLFDEGGEVPAWRPEGRRVGNTVYTPGRLHELAAAAEHVRSRATAAIQAEEQRQRREASEAGMHAIARPYGGTYSNPKSEYGTYSNPKSEYATGGKIEGPGSGTSDSISAIKKPGTFIVPADVVKAKGDRYFEKILDRHGIRPGNPPDHPGGTPVRLSNGEYEIPPEVVRAEGTEMFNSLLKKFHHPVQGEQTGMVNGGAIRTRGLPMSVERAISSAAPHHILSRPRWAH